jgi:hypothetical protein
MIKIIDSIMGSGKTSWAIQMINSNPDKKFIYITPYLDEVQRIKSECPGFEEPEVTVKGELKLDSLNRLLAQGKNIASTHSLFKLTTKETISSLKKHDYTLIIDEVMEVVSTDDFKKDDLPTILAAGLAHIDQNTGYLIWDKEDYDGLYNRVKHLCQTKSVVVIDNVALVWVFPATIFKHFKETYILTYMFDAQIQRYYFDMNKMPYEYYSVKDAGNRNYELIEYVQNYDKSKYKINIYTGKKNDIGTTSPRKKSVYTLLSSSWYDRAAKDDLKRIKNNMVGYFKNDLKSPSDVNVWTAFKKNELELKASPYSKGFLVCNVRAMNSYRHKKAIAYVINKFINPTIVKFFKLYNIQVDQEKYALSELLQFIFRTAIRDGKEINLYIPSVRMRHLLQDWLEVEHAD